MPERFQPDPTKPSTFLNRVLARMSYEHRDLGKPYNAALLRNVLADELGRWLVDRGEWTEADRKAWKP